RSRTRSAVCASTSTPASYASTAAPSRVCTRLGSTPAASRRAATRAASRRRSCSDSRQRSRSPAAEPKLALAHRERAQTRVAGNRRGPQLGDHEPVLDLVAHTRRFAVLFAQGVAARRPDEEHIAARAAAVLVWHPGKI